MRRALGTSLVGMALLALTACGGSSGGGSPDTTTSAPAPLVASAAPVTPSVAPTPEPTDALGYPKSAVIGTESRTAPDPVWGDFGWKGYTPDYPNVTDKGVAFKYWGCEKKSSEVFNGVLIRFDIEYGFLDGHSPDDRNPVDLTAPSGSGFIHIQLAGDEMSNHYTAEVTTEGRCRWQIDFIARGGTKGTDMGTKVLEQTGTGSRSFNTPALKAHWYLTWQYGCTGGVTAPFYVRDSEMGNGQIVYRPTPLTGDNGVFEQGASSGPRVISVITGASCNWRVMIFQP